jgi:hypothetical protein
MLVYGPEREQIFVLRDLLDGYFWNVYSLS